jgi:hypothetical protein
VAGPRVHLGTVSEVHVTSYKSASELPNQDEYEVLVYDDVEERRLVAAVEVVSPSNKDRPENRRLFVTKCAGLLREHVSVTIVDVMTTRQFNLYADLLDLDGYNGAPVVPERPSIYAATFRWRRVGDTAQLEAWADGLAVGRPLPTLPLWLADHLSVPLELEVSYEDACRILRIP